MAASRVAGKGFSPTENALSAGKGDGSVQRGRNLLSTIALLKLDVYADDLIVDSLVTLY